MADTKISALSDASTLDGSELVLLSQSGADAKTTLTALQNYNLIAPRPLDWPAMPTVATNEIALLVSVHDVDSGSNFVRLSCSLSSGTYSVDWGDGTSTTGIASGANADHTYDYADVDLGAATSEGWKTAILVITTSGGNITSFDNSGQHPNETGATLNSSGSNWIEAVLNIPSTTTIPSWVGAVYSRKIRRITYTGLGEVSGGSVLNAFSNLLSLEYIVFPSTWGTTLTNVQSMFSSCNSLKYVKFGSGFGPNVTTASSMFYRNHSLRYVDFGDVFGSALTNVASMFFECTALTYFSFPAGCGPGVTSCNTFARGCFALEDFDLPAGFGASCTNVGNMFRDCRSLRHARLPAAFAPNVDDAQFMFYGTYSLVDIDWPTSFGSLVLNVTGMFGFTYALSSIILPSGFGASITTSANVFQNATNLAKVENFGCPISFSLPAFSHLSSAALDKIYTDLPSVTATITVGSCFGTSADDPTIATAKGWTVIGS